MLIEGQFGVGDVVRVGGVSGLVERITLRTTVLRDIEGAVHIVPNGEITTVTNMNKAWSRAVLHVGVAYREDVDRVLEVLRDLLRDFHADPEWGPLLLEEPVVPGVESFADSAVVIRLMAKTLPLKQWDVARELRRRIKNRFAQEGIEIPFPHVTFYWGDGQIPSLPPTHGTAPDHHGNG
jgi:moderate conductance mechanosensitive channel